MPSATDSTIKRIQQWLAGEYGPDNSEFDSARDLALSAKKRGVGVDVAITTIANIAKVLKI